MSRCGRSLGRTGPSSSRSSRSSSDRPVLARHHNRFTSALASLALAALPGQTLLLWPGGGRGSLPGQRSRHGDTSEGDARKEVLLRIGLIGTQHCQGWGVHKHTIVARKRAQAVRYSIWVRWPSDGSGGAAGGAKESYWQLRGYRLCEREPAGDEQQSRPARAWVMELCAHTGEEAGLLVVGRAGTVFESLRVACGMRCSHGGASGLKVTLATGRGGGEEAAGGQKGPRPLCKGLLTLPSDFLLPHSPPAPLHTINAVLFAHKLYLRPRGVKAGILRRG